MKLFSTLTRRNILLRTVFQIIIFLGSTIVNETVIGQTMRITEYMYSGANGEFIEFTNTGAAAVDMTGWSFDDIDRVAGAQSLSAFGIVQPGESVILTESVAGTFRTAWNLCPGIKIIGGLTNNLGREDEINLYDNNNVLVDRLTYGDQTFSPGSIRTQNRSGRVSAAGLGNNSISQWSLSAVADVEASFTSSGGDIGSPGKSTRSTVSFNPCVVVGGAPTIVMNVATTSNYVDGGVTISPASPYAVSGVINDPTDPAKLSGIDFTIADDITAVASLTVSVSSSNTSVVPNANILLTGTGSSRNIKITPIAVGFATINVTVSDGTLTTTYGISYAASAASVNTGSTRFHTGTSDASTAIMIDANHMFVADDENQVLRLYNRQNSGLPINGFDYSVSLGIVASNPEVDIESSVRIGNRIYWLGSHSNSANSGAFRPNRYRLFATDVSGSGASSILSYVGRYDNLRTDLINWDVTNLHGLGTNYFGLSASAAAGVFPETSSGGGFNIEGLTVAPDGSTAYICFRAPISPASNRTKALIVPLLNLASFVTGNPTTATATFGAPIQLDLGGRGIREIKRNASGQYLIIAGPHDGATGIAPKDFRFYTWTGNPANAPVIRSANLTALLSDGSFESIVDLPDPLLSTSQLQVLVDNGDAIFYANGVIAKELPNNNHKKFRSELITLGQPPIPLSVTYIKTNLSVCGTANDGTITITATGGTAPYTYSWTGESGSNHTPFSAGNVPLLTGLNYGYYNVTVTDAASNTITILNIHIEKAFFVYITNSGSSSSSCGNSGSIILYGNAGVQPYTYSIDGSTYQPGNSFTGLAAGSYTGYIKDAAGCVSTKSISVAAVAPIAVSVFTKAASSCAADGSMQVFRTGGIPGYTYSIISATGPWQVSNLFTGLAAGPYTAYVKDAAGCVGQLTANVAAGVSLTVTASKVNTSTCVNDGSIQVNVSGGIAPYTYSKDNGVTFQAGNSFAGLAQGSYAIMVKDFKGCTGTLNVTINLNMIVVTASIVNATTCVSNNGRISLFRTGGYGPYTYSIDGNAYQSGTVFTNVPAGTYTGYVKDARTCIGTLTGIVVGPTGCSPTFSRSNHPATGLQVMNSELKIHAYPNPSQSEFTVLLKGYDPKDKISIIVTDILGRKVYQAEGAGKLQYRFGVNFPTGVYNVQAMQAGNHQSIKLVKE